MQARPRLFSRTPAHERLFPAELSIGDSRATQNMITRDVEALNEHNDAWVTTRRRAATASAAAACSVSRGGRSVWGDAWAVCWAPAWVSVGEGLIGNCRLQKAISQLRAETDERSREVVDCQAKHEVLGRNARLAAAGRNARPCNAPSPTVAGHGGEHAVSRGSPQRDPGGRAGAQGAAAAAARLCSQLDDGLAGQLSPLTRLRRADAQAAFTGRIMRDERAFDQEAA